MENLAKAVGAYNTDWALYEYASKYWDGKMNAVSCSRTLRIAMNDKHCPSSIDPFESLVDHEPELYAKPEECGQVWDPIQKIYVDDIDFKKTTF